jgi:hypothetical protein
MATPNGFCSLHSDPSRPSELGRKSGQSRRNPRTEAIILPIPKTAGDLHRALGLIFSKISSGEMSEKLGRSLAYIASVLVKTIELSDHEIRLRAIEQIISSIRSKGE